MTGNEVGPSTRKKTKEYSEDAEKNLQTKEKGFTFEEVLQGKDQVIAAKDALITQLCKNIKLLEDKVKYLSGKLPTDENENSKNKTFSKALNTNGNTETNVSSKREETGAKPIFGNNQLVNNIQQNHKESNYIIINPNKKQENKQTKKELIEHVNLRDLQLGIQKVFNLKDGGIKIQCQSKEGMEKLKSEAVQKMSKNYEMKTQSKKHPKIKIIGLEENYSAAELLDCIRSQNDTVSENSKLELIVIRKMKTKYMAIVEVDPNTFKSIMKSGMVLINLSVCPVFEHIDVLRCFTCTGYHHTNKNCKIKNIICIKCGLTGHSSQDCETDIKHFCCPNCLAANEKHKLNFLINHGPFDRECEIFKKKIEIERKRIEYE